MRKFDFTQLGGMPWYQDQFDFLQKAYREPIKALSALGGVGPYKLFGIEETSPGVYSDGAIFHEGEIVPFVGGAEASTIVITTYNTSLLFADGISKQVMQRKEATFGSGDVQFNFADLKLFHEGFGATAISGWTEFFNHALYGRLLYNYNSLTRVVSVRGWALHVHNSSSDTQTWAHSAYGSLPEGLGPSETVPSSWGLQFPTSIQKVPSGGYIDVIRDINGEVYDQGIVAVLPNGNILMVCRRLAVGVPMPRHIINFSYQI